MANLFYYQHSQRKTALTLLFNVALIGLLWALAPSFLENYGDQAGTSELLFWIDIVVGVLVPALLLLAVYFWRSNKTFYIRLSATELEVNDPLFGDFNWKVKLEDITEISHHYEPHTGYIDIRVNYTPNQWKPLTINYRYNRRKLYAAIAQAAPHIKLPTNPYRFKKR